MNVKFYYRESLFVKIKWVLFESQGTASVKFENDEDPPKALGMLRCFNAVINKKNPR